MNQIYSSNRKIPSLCCSCRSMRGYLISNGMHFTTRPIDFSVNIPYLELIRRKRYPITYEGEIIKITEVFYCLNCGRVRRICYDNPIFMKRILDDAECNKYLGDLYAGNEFIGGLYGKQQ